MVLPTHMPGMEVRLHSPAMHHSSFHVTSECADQTILETKAPEDMRLDLYVMGGSS
jgi:hypothetical protein